MLTDSLLIFGNQDNLEFARELSPEMLIVILILFVVGQVLRSAALFSLNRSFEKNELFWSFIPLYRLAAYLKTIANSKSEDKKKPLLYLSIFMAILSLFLLVSLLFVDKFDLFISTLTMLVGLDLMARISLFYISKTFKNKPTIIWIIPLIGSIAILLRKEKTLFVSL